MSYHFYDMGFKDGYKKALQQLDEQRGGGILPGAEPGGGMNPVSKIAGDFASRGTPTARATGRRPVAGGRGGRGFYGRGHSGRAHVVSMIQSKTWVRKKDEGASGETKES